MKAKCLKKPAMIIATLALVVGLLPAYAVADSTDDDATAPVAEQIEGTAPTAVTDIAEDEAPAAEDETPAAEQPAVTEEEPAADLQTPEADDEATAVDEQSDPEATPAAKSDTPNADGVITNALAGASSLFVTADDTITVTIHASTREGELDSDYAPIVCDTVPKGSTYNQAIAYITDEEGTDFIDLNGTGRYTLYAAWDTKHSFSTYGNSDAARNDRFTGNEVLNEDTDVYIPYSMSVTAEITVTAPQCGQDASVAPQVTFPEGAKWFSGAPDGYPKWIVSGSSPATYTGDFVGDEDYYFYAIVNLPFGYYSNNNSSAKVNGGEFVTNWMTGTRYGFFGKVTAAHHTSNPVIDDVVEPTCTEPGSHVEVLTCDGCDKEFSRETITDDALDHDWGEWKVVKEATADADGLEQRTCSRCDEVEERPIPATGESADESGDKSDDKSEDKSDESPKTGDTLPVGFVCLIGIMAAAALAFSWRKVKA